MRENPIFIVIATLLGSILTCAMFEKGVSLIKGRSFNRKYMWAIWLIVFAITGFVAEVVRVIKLAWSSI